MKFDFFFLSFSFLCFVGFFCCSSPVIQSLSTNKVSAVTAVTAASTVVPSPSTASITKGNKEFLSKISSRNRLVLLYASGLTMKVDSVTVGSFVSVVNRV